MTLRRKRFLHVGCGEIAPEFLPARLRDGEWDEVRLDINPAVKPDLVGSITDMSMVASGRFDAVYSSHNIEHLFPHEVSLAVKEFARVLASDGFLLITCPDLQAVAKRIVEGDLNEALYVSPAGPIAAIDVIYGYRKELQNGNHWMAHKTGFTARSLAEYLVNNGFAKVTVARLPKSFALAGIAYREKNANVSGAEGLAEELANFDTV